MADSLRFRYPERRSGGLKTSQVAAVPLSRQSYFSASEFDTPEKIAQAYKAASAGDMRMLVRLAEEIENDPRIGGPLRTRRLAVSVEDMKIEPGDTSDAAKNAAKVWEQRFQKLDLDEVVAHLQGTAVRPFEAVEIIRDGFEIVELRIWGANQFRFDYQESGEQFRVLTEAQPDRGEVIDPRQWIIKLSHEKSHSLISRRGSVRAIAGRWLLMRMFLVYWASFAERFGSPMIKGTYPIGSTDSQIRKLKSAVSSLGSDAAAVVEEGMLLEIMEAAKNSGRDVFSPAIDRLAADCAVQILGGTLTSAGNDGGYGTNALGTVHNEIKDDLRDADGRSTAKVLTKQLVEPQHRFEFGDSVPPPKVVYQVEPDVNMEAELVISQGILNMGGELEIEKEYERFGRDVPDHLKGTMLKQAAQSVDPFAQFQSRSARLEAAFRGGIRPPLTPP